MFYQHAISSHILSTLWLFYQSLFPFLLQFNSAPKPETLLSMVQVQILIVPIANLRSFSSANQRKLLQIDSRLLSRVQLLSSFSKERSFFGENLTQYMHILSHVLSKSLQNSIIGGQFPQFCLYITSSHSRRARNFHSYSSSGKVFLDC